MSDLNKQARGVDTGFDLVASSNGERCFVRIVLLLRRPERVRCGYVGAQDERLLVEKGEPFIENAFAIHCELSLIAAGGDLQTRLVLGVFLVRQLLDGCVTQKDDALGVQELRAKSEQWKYS